MDYKSAVEALKAKYPAAVVRKWWMPKLGKDWFKVISEPSVWQDGHYSHIDLSVPCPTLKAAVISAASALSADASAR